MSRHCAPQAFCAHQIARARHFTHSVDKQETCQNKKQQQRDEIAWGEAGAAVFLAGKLAVRAGVPSVLRGGYQPAPSWTEGVPRRHSIQLLRRCRSRSHDHHHLGSTAIFRGWPELSAESIALHVRTRVSERAEILGTDEQEQESGTRRRLYCIYNVLL